MNLRACLFAVGVLAITLAPSAFGAPPASPAPAAPTAATMPDFDHMPPADLYHFGTELLKHGLEFNQAIDVLSRAVKQDPNNVDYQLGLGCAYVSRFASVALAQRQSAIYADEQKIYASRRETWEKAQNSPGDPEYNAVPPTPPAVPATPDDRRRFRLSRDEAVRTLTQLAQQSLAAFDAADRLSQSAPAEQRARAEYVRGWGLFLMRRYGKKLGGAVDLDVVQDRVGNAAGVVLIKPEEVIACFRQATTDAPGQVDYWHSLALACVPQYVDPFASGGLSPFEAFTSASPAPADEKTHVALDALRRAQALKPGNFDLLYQYAVIAASTDPVAAQSSLEQAAQRQSTNALPWYLLAAQYFRQAESAGAGAQALEDRAVATVRTGNAAPGLAAIPIVAPVPPELKKAWDYRPALGIGDGVFVLEYFIPDFRRLIAARATQGANAAVVASAQAMMSIGQKAISSYNAGDLDTTDPKVRGMQHTRLLFGIILCEDAYSQVKKAQAAHPDDIKAAYLAETAGLMRYLNVLEKEATS